VVIKPLLSKVVLVLSIMPVIAILVTMGLTRPEPATADLNNPASSCTGSTGSTPCPRPGQPGTLTIRQITRDGKSVSSESNITLRALDGHVVSTGLRAGDALPDDVQVDVSADETITLASQNGRSSITLQAGAVATFHYTGTVESVALSAGKASVDDPLGFFHLSAGNGLDVKPIQ
jgi:hypothetical protein